MRLDCSVKVSSSLLSMRQQQPQGMIFSSAWSLAETRGTGEAPPVSGHRCARSDGPPARRSALAGGRRTTRERAPHTPPPQSPRENAPGAPTSRPNSPAPTFPPQLSRPFDADRLPAQGPPQHPATPAPAKSPKPGRPADRPGRDRSPAPTRSRDQSRDQRWA